MSGYIPSMWKTQRQRDNVLCTFQIPLLLRLSGGLNAVKENTEDEGWFQVVMAVEAVLNRTVCGDCTG